MAAIRYVKVRLEGRPEFFLRVQMENQKFIRGIEVNKEGDEIATKAADQRVHIIEKVMLIKCVPYRMDNKYGTLVRDKE